jgi:hypothetical protein
MHLPPPAPRAGLPAEPVYLERSRKGPAMPEQPLTDPSGERPVQDRLQELAQFLRQARHLSPAARQTLADLVAELSLDLKPDAMTPAEKAHLADTIAQLTQALQQRRGAGPIQAARDRVARAIARAEADAPVATGFLQRLLDALSNIGI